MAVNIANTSNQNLESTWSMQPPGAKRDFFGIHPRSFISSSWDILMTDIIKIGFTKRIEGQKKSFIRKDRVHPIEGKSPAFNGVAKDQVETMLSLKQSQIHYVKGAFFFDLVTMVPWDQIFNTMSKSYLLIYIKMFRLWRLPILVKKTPHFLFFKKRIEAAVGGGRTLTNLVVLLACLLIFLHLEGCLFFLIGRLSDYTNSPVSESRNATVLEQYVEAMFYAVSNTVPVAYKPKDAPHQWVILMLAMAGAALYAMIIGAVASFSNGLDASGRIYRQKVDELNEYVFKPLRYMNWKKLPAQLRTKMRHYYALKYRGKFFEESSLLDTLNQSLRNEIAVHNCRELIDQVPFLQRKEDDGRTDSFIGRIAKAMVACFYV
ncbi:anaphase-promoting complex subunit Hcn1, partial [Dinochytrium kinnereticum]